MAYEADFGEWVREHFAALGTLEIRRMFGGAGVYAGGGPIFALLDDGVVWLKGDESNIPALQAAGSRQFTFPGKDGEIMHLGYWSLPDSATDDADEAVVWARGAIDVALRKAAGKRKPRSRG